MSGIEEELLDLEELEEAFIQEWEELKRQIRDIKEEQNRPLLIPTLKDTD